MPATKYRTKLTAGNGLAWDETFTAAVAFTGCPYKFCAPGSIVGEVIPAAGGACAYAFGIVQGAPAAGQKVQVRLMGKSIVAACMASCNLIQGTWVGVGSHGGACPSVCGLAHARWASSTVSSAASTSAWGGYGEVYLLGPSFATCVAQAS